MKKWSYFALIVLLVSVCGCGTSQKTDRVNDDNKKPPLSADWKPKAEKDPNIRLLENVKQVTEVGKEITIQEETSSFSLTVDKVYTTQTFEEAVEEWSEIALEEAEVEGNKVTGENRILYIEYQVKNRSDEVLEFYANQISAYLEKDGELYQASGELGYNNHSGKGKSVNLTKITGGDTVSFRVGYILDRESKGKPLYIELSNSASDTEFIVIPINDKD